MNKKDLLNIPSVSELLNEIKFENFHNENFLKFKIKEEIDYYRKLAKKGKLILSRKEIVDEIIHKLSALSLPSVQSVINATGIVLHTGLGRAPLSKELIANISDKMSGYVNLEYDLSLIHI